MTRFDSWLRLVKEVVSLIQCIESHKVGKTASHDSVSIPVDLTAAATIGAVNTD